MKLASKFIHSTFLCFIICMLSLLESNFLFWLFDLLPCPLSACCKVLADSDSVDCAAGLDRSGLDGGC